MGDYPVDSDFANAERGDLTWDVQPTTKGEDFSWNRPPTPPTGDAAAWDMPAPVAHVGSWSAAAACENYEEEERRLAVGPNGALLDLEPTRWGMRIEGVDKDSQNRFEVGSTIVWIEGVSISQTDNSEESLDRVVEVFGSYFADGAAIHLALEEELLLGWGQAPNDIERLTESLDLMTEFCPKGLLV